MTATHPSNSGPRAGLPSVRQPAPARGQTASAAGVLAALGRDRTPQRAARPRRLRLAAMRVGNQLAVRGPGSFAGNAHALAGGGSWPIALEATASAAGGAHGQSPPSAHVLERAQARAVSTAPIRLDSIRAAVARHESAAEVRARERPGTPAVATAAAAPGVDALAAALLSRIGSELRDLRVAAGAARGPGNAERSAPRRSAVEQAWRSAAAGPRPAAQSPIAAARPSPDGALVDRVETALERHGETLRQLDARLAPLPELVQRALDRPATFAESVGE